MNDIPAQMPVRMVNEYAYCPRLFNPRERLQLVEEMKRLMNQDEDQTLLLDAGAVEGERPIPEIAYVGKVWRPEQRSQVV